VWKGSNKRSDQATQAKKKKKKKKKDKTHLEALNHSLNTAILRHHLFKTQGGDQGFWL